MAALSLTQLRAIDRSKETLVPAAETVLDAAGVVNLKAREFGDSQLRNLLAVATETESPAVVVNFIRYQIGRDGKKKPPQGWAREHKGKRLGDRFIHEMEAEDGAIEKAFAEIKDLGDDLELRQLARIQLIRHFLGFTSRYLKYLGLQRDLGGAA